jgi:hypothetical protein
MDSCDQRLGVDLIEQDPRLGVVDDFAGATGARSDDGGPAGVRLRHHDSELLHGRADQRSARAIQLAQPHIIDPPGEAHICWCAGAQAIEPRAAAGDYEPFIRTAKRVDQHVKSFLWHEPGDR